MRIMVTGGGTGGHTSPLLAVIEELHRRDPALEIQWVGRRGNIEERICRNLSIPFRPVPVEGWPRKRTPRRLWVAGKLAMGVAQSWMLIRRYKPQLVFGVGGYVSLPLVFAAQRMGVPTVLHEQNRWLGMANRMCAGKATRLCLSYEDTKGSFSRESAMVTGNPVRSAFLNPPAREEALAAFGLEPGAPVVLVSGGSQGAKSVNEAIAGSMHLWRPGEARLLWMTGQHGVEAAREAATKAVIPVQVFPYIDNMAAACVAADVIVGRAGASSTAEIAVLGKPSVLIPFPHATDNHQEHNARAFESAGAAELLLDAACTPDSLHACLRKLLADAARLEDMGRAALSLAKPSAAERIAECILSLVFVAQ